MTAIANIITQKGMAVSHNGTLNAILSKYDSMHNGIQIVAIIINPLINGFFTFINNNLSEVSAAITRIGMKQVHIDFTIKLLEEKKNLTFYRLRWHNT